MSVLAIRSESVAQEPAVHRNAFAGDVAGRRQAQETHGGSDLSYVAMGKFAMGLINDAPGLVAHIIALAADDDLQQRLLGLSLGAHQ